MPPPAAARVLAPDAAGIAAAAEALRQGRLVVFPTETVYGLGAHALYPAAVAAIFAAKGRPADNPVIVHVPDEAAARRLVRAWPDAAERLARRFWPGPLTLVLPRAAGVPDGVTGGLDTVAVRCPAHPVAQALLRRAGVPVAAPSANRSGRPSSTRVADAVEDLGDAVAVYLDGGDCPVGVESTVVGWQDGQAVLLRSGGVPREALEGMVGPLHPSPPSSRPLAPGMKYRHYAPRTPLCVVAPADLPELHRRHGAAWAWLVSPESGLAGPGVTVVAPRRDGAAWARRLFALLRDADREGRAAIAVEAIAEEGLGAAVMERLRKAQDAATDDAPS